MIETNSVINIKIILISIICILLFSCSNSIVNSKYVITNFTEKTRDTLYTIEGENYTTGFVKLKGTVNDSIYIIINDGYKKYFNGDIDTISKVDYYGTNPMKFEFDPYKAEKGKLEVEFCIL
ncbi:MAG: hypothetical protein BM557_09890 [Flavobacterium sp. MedPE-SWcel]|uniref:hypothetical protein n=1 Tax=uncultured Flavobacterium sp. TaxID=165435 RepID=UPI00090F4BF3|nr:hypothetical protein [uncultured Flavobacterium sp.]OIQ16613.1 MAG: hypothetical protein BM557_09890 [Flavobacterium sp. MedPE-SWcel]